MNINAGISWLRCTLVAAAWMTAASATAQADDGLRPSPEQISLARDTCINVMHIKQGVVPFDACVESLSQTLGVRTQTEILARSYKDCLAVGHLEGSSELSACTLDRKADRSAAWNRNPGGMVSKGTAASYMQPGRSYSESNPEERRLKEEYSCARLGMLPGSAPFGLCTAQLDAALRSVEYSN